MIAPARVMKRCAFSTRCRKKIRQVPEVVALRAEIAGGDGSTAEERAALEQLLERDPKNASILARLGAAYRRINPYKVRRTIIIAR